MTPVKRKRRSSTVKDRPGTLVYVVTLPATDMNTHRDIRRLERIIQNLNDRRQEYTVEDVIAAYRHPGNGHSLFSFMEQAVARQKQLNHVGTATNYRAALMSFRSFRLDEDVALDEIDHLLIEEYEAWLRSHGLVPNSISFYMRILRAVYNRAVEQGLSPDRKPFRTVFTGTERTRKRAISLNEITRIHDLKLSSPKHQHLKFPRDLFLFLFYCRGMSFVDAAYLKKSDIENGVLTYRRQKTGQLLQIKLEPEIRAIIKQYSIEESPYLLPIIHPCGDARRQYESALRRVNNALKEIGKMSRLTIPLSTYVSRHSWATIAKRKNIPLTVISEALGHDSESMIRTYLASIDPSVVDKTNRLIISCL